jgi:hypothetical protein
MKTSYSLHCAAMLLLICMSNRLLAQTNTFEKTFGGNKSDYGHAFASTADGGFIITGLTLSFGDTLGDTYLIKTDADGNQQWVQIISGPQLEGGNSVVQTADGGYFIVCHTESYGAGDCDSWAIKTDNLGNIQWSQTYGSPFDDVGYRGRQTADGHYVVTGIYRGSDWRGDAFVVKYAPDGSQEWIKNYGDTAGTQNGIQIIQTTDDGFIVVGGTTSGANGQGDILVFKIDAGGNLLWSKNFGGQSEEDGYGLCAASGGGFVICGYSKSFSSGDADAYLVKIDDAGTQLWSRNYGGINDDAATQVAEAPDGGYVLTGSTKSFGDNMTAFIIKTDSYGNMSWMKTFGAPNYLTECQWITTCPDGGFAIVGSKEEIGTGNADLYFVKTDNTGNVAAGISVLTSTNQDFTIYPNPAANMLNVSFGRLLINPDIRIYNAMGNLVMETHSQKSINISSLASGIYYVTASEGNKLFSKKFTRN